MKHIVTFILLCVFLEADAQFLDQLGKKSERAVKRTVERKVERKAEKKTAEAMDEILEPKKSTKKSSQETRPQGTVESGSHFTPQGRLIFEEAFKSDMQGDFPARWITNAGGEVITINGQKALRMYPKSSVLPKFSSALPENYALSFDLITANLGYHKMAGSLFGIRLMDELAYGNKSKFYTQFHFSLWKGSEQPNQIKIENFGRGIQKISNLIRVSDINNKLNGTIKCMVVRNTQRLRFYMDGQKVLDLPNVLSHGMGNFIQFYTNDLNTESHAIVAISNIKITEENNVSRTQLEIDLIDKGSFATNNILFASGAANITASSHQILNQIGELLLKNPQLKFKITGHTDADGKSADNIKLSEERAKAVKKYLVDKYNIQPDNLMIEGKGDTQPVLPNTTAANKAQNRRVEFTKL